MNWWRSLKQQRQGWEKDKFTYNTKKEAAESAKVAKAPNANTLEKDATEAAKTAESSGADYHRKLAILNDAKTNERDVWHICAEPSPDALAAFSGALTGSASYKQNAAAQLAASISEQAASIGLRTQSITLLRDSAYRLCEGYLNGALDARQFKVLHRRFQNIMVANLAIEQLTGYAKPTIVTIGGNASANAAGGLQQAQKVLDEGIQTQKAKEASAPKTRAEAAG